MLCWPTTHNISCSMGSPLHLISHHPRVFQTSFIFPRPNIQNAAWMDYDTTCILAREIRLNEIRALCFSAEIGKRVSPGHGGGQPPYGTNLEMGKPSKNTHKCCLDFKCELLISWCTSTYIFLGKEIGSNWLDGAFVVLSRRLKVLIDDPGLVSWLGVQPTYYIGMDVLLEKAATSLKHEEFLFASEFSSFQSTVCSLLALCRPIQP